MPVTALKKPADENSLSAIAHSLTKECSTVCLILETWSGIRVRRKAKGKASYQNTEIATEWTQGTDCSRRCQGTQTAVWGEQRLGAAF